MMEILDYKEEELPMMVLRVVWRCAETMCGELSAIIPGTLKMLLWFVMN